MSIEPDPLESVLTEYERRKQDETRRMAQRAFRPENARKEGSEHLRRFAPTPDRLFARSWTQEGLGEVREHGSVPAVDIDELWVREQLLSFVRDALDLA